MLETRRVTVNDLLPVGVASFLSTLKMWFCFTTDFKEFTANILFSFNQCSFLFFFCCAGQMIFIVVNERTFVDGWLLIVENRVGHFSSTPATIAATFEIYQMFSFGVPARLRRSYVFFRPTNQLAWFSRFSHACSLLPGQFYYEPLRKTHKSPLRINNNKYYRICFVFLLARQQKRANSIVLSTQKTWWREPYRGNLYSIKFLE